MDILEKLGEMKEKYTREDTPMINSQIEKAKKMLLIESVAGSDAVQYLIKEMKQEVEKIDAVLLTVGSTQLKDYDRDRLLDRKVLWEKVIGYFDVEQERKSIENFISSN